MSKFLILGDIHGRTCWKDIISLEKPDKVIFLGDYVGSHEDISSEQQIDNMNEILDYKISNPDTVILLRGNHDLQHLNRNDGDWGCCSYFPKVGKYMYNLSGVFYNLTQWIYVLDDKIIFSHAGITNTWLKDSDIKDIKDINHIGIDEQIFGFRPGPDNYFDTDGSSIYQSCIWVRPQSLISDPIHNYIQVVGHTTVYNIVNLSDYIHTLTNPVYLCDNLPQEYIIYEDEIFKKRSYKIKLQNRDNNDLYLIRQKGDYFVLREKSDDMYVSSIRIIGDIDNIDAIDPSGGPFLKVGDKINKTTTIKKIEYENNILKIFLDE